VIGASQYTIQVSGSTIFVAPQSVLPLRNVPVVTAGFAARGREARRGEDIRLRPGRIARLDLDGGERAVALCYRGRGRRRLRGWRPSAGESRQALRFVLERGLPLILVGAATSAD